FLLFLQISALFRALYFPISTPLLPNIIAAKFPVVKEKFDNYMDIAPLEYPEFYKKFALRFLAIKCCRHRNRYDMIQVTRRIP
ncbi:MAG: hypothetical protein KH050_10100, partial [Clostridiaceae bacterium]|nr:hypothetical protein [Clostridiaceae bacterium]